jgi:hypothetical protein
MKPLFASLIATCAFSFSAAFGAGDLTGVEIALPDGFRFVSSNSTTIVDGFEKQLAARAAGDVTLSIRHDPDRKFPVNAIGGFLEDGKKAMAGQSMIAMRSTAITDVGERTWGVAVIDAKAGKKELVQFLLVTSFHETLLIFEFQGPKKRERFIEAATRQFMSGNQFKVVGEPGATDNPDDAQ